MSSSLMVVIVIVVIGALLRAAGLVTKSHADTLAGAVFSVSLPATILVSLDRIVFAPRTWTLPAAACLITLPLLTCAWLIARRLHLPRARQGAFLLATGCINSVYFAYPVVSALFGEEGLARAILFDLGQTLLTLTVLYGLAVWHGPQTASPQAVVRRLLTAPPLWALGGILLLKWFHLQLPVWLHEGLLPIHLTTTPLASLVLGLSISVDAVRRSAGLALLGVAVRMAGGFLFGLSAVWMLDLSGLERAVVILVAAMPSAVTAVIFASDAELDEDLVASVVALSICVGMALLPWLPFAAAWFVGETAG